MKEVALGLALAASTAAAAADTSQTVEGNTLETRCATSAPARSSTSQFSIENGFLRIRDNGSIQNAGLTLESDGSTPVCLEHAEFWMLPGSYKINVSDGQYTITRTDGNHAFAHGVSQGGLPFPVKTQGGVEKLYFPTSRDSVTNALSDWKTAYKHNGRIIWRSSEQIVMSPRMSHSPLNTDYVLTYSVQVLSNGDTGFSSTHTTGQIADNVDAKVSRVAAVQPQRVVEKVPSAPPIPEHTFTLSELRERACTIGDYYIAGNEGYCVLLGTVPIQFEGKTGNMGLVATVHHAALNDKITTRHVVVGQDRTEHPFSMLVGNEPLDIAILGLYLQDTQHPLWSFTQPQKGQLAGAIDIGTFIDAKPPKELSIFYQTRSGAQRKMMRVTDYAVDGLAVRISPIAQIKNGQAKVYLGSWPIPGNSGGPMLLAYKNGGTDPFQFALGGVLRGRLGSNVVLDSDIGQVLNASGLYQVDGLNELVEQAKAGLQDRSSRVYAQARTVYDEVQWQIKNLGAVRKPHRNHK